MEKISENYYRKGEFHTPSNGVGLQYEIEVIDGEHLDTVVSMEGTFTVAGSKRHEFAKKFGELINKYRI